MHKKAQAAMEFLMTYGWAILVVLVAIGALAYFGVLNPARFLPASCTLMPGLACSSFKVDGSASGGNVELRVQNGMGSSLTNLNFQLAGDINNGACGGNQGTAATLNDGAIGTWTITCTTAPIAGDRFKSDIQISYTQAGISHTRTGSITTEVEAS